jgi:hypothetical protein
MMEGVLEGLVMVYILVFHWELLHGIGGSLIRFTSWHQLRFVARNDTPITIIR